MDKFAFGFENMNAPSESITKKLKDPNTTLEDLLKEDELLQELKSQNNDLINFFNKEKIKQMLNYITKEQEDDKLKGYKFPFVCSQIFGLEIDNIMKYFFITNKEMQELENKDNKDNPEIKKEEEKKEKENEVKNEEEKKDKEPLKEGEKKEEEKEEKKDEIQEENKKDEQTTPLEKKEEENKDKNKEENKEENKGENKEKEKEKEEEENKEKEENQSEENQSEDNQSQPENPEKKIELIDYLFNNFFPKDETVKLNYVLCGYFSSLINNLLQINSLSFLKYIYLERQDFFYKMVSHSYRKSISDTLSKLLHFESYLQNNETLDEKTNEDMRDQRKLILFEIFEKINIDMNNEDLNSLYFFVTGLIDETDIKEEKPLFEEIIKEKKIIKAIIKEPFDNLNLVNIDSNDDNEGYIILLNRRKNFGTLVDMISFFLKNIIKLKLDLPSNEIELKTAQNKLFLIGSELSEILKPLLQNNFIKKNENEKSQLQSFNDYYLKPLGEYKIKIIDLLTHLIPYFKNVSNFFDEILIQVGFFKSAFEFLLQYEWNNIYQESLLNLFKSLFDNADYHKEIHNHLIKEIKIFDIIQAHTNLDNIEKFNYTTTQDNSLSEEERGSLPIKRGYYSFFISLSYKLNWVMGGTPVDIQGDSNRKGSFTFMKRVPDEGDQKGAMNMLYGGFIDEPEEKDEKEEENLFSYECMKEFINDNWREFFGLNIENVIKQYEDKNWPKMEKKPFSMAEDFNNDNDKEVDLLNVPRDRGLDMFGDNEYNFENDEDNKERRGLYEANEDNNNNDEVKHPFYSEDNFDFGNDKENKNDENINNDMVNNFRNENEFDFGDNDNKDDKDINQKKEENVDEIKNEENKEKIEEDNNVENKENNKEENKKDNEGENNEINTEENKNEGKINNKEEKEEEKKEENKEINTEEKKEKIKEENKEENKEDNKEETKEINKEENKEENKTE